MSSGCLKMPSVSSLSNFCWSSSSWWRAFWGSLFTLGFETAFCAIVAFDVGVKDVAVLIQSDVNLDLLRE